jgi:hypothetical protein
MFETEPRHYAVVSALSEADPVLDAMLIEHVSTYDEVLAYLYLGEVADYAGDLATQGPSGIAALKTIALVMEEALQGDEHTTNLIRLGFLTGLKARGALTQVRPLFGPKLGFWADME